MPSLQFAFDLHLNLSHNALQCVNRCTGVNLAQNRTCLGQAQLITKVSWREWKYSRMQFLLSPFALNYVEFPFALNFRSP